jgi:hypothetical protein
MLDKVEIGEIYVNKKNVKMYQVESIGFHTELEEITVHYKPLYDSPYTDYYRPLEGPKGFKVKFKGLEDELEDTYNAQF